MQFLLNQGADIILKNASGWTALHFAAANGKHEICELLCGHPQQVDILPLDDEGDV